MFVGNFFGISTPFCFLHITASKNETTGPEGLTPRRESVKSRVNMY